MWPVSPTLLDATWLKGKDTRVVTLGCVSRSHKLTHIHTHSHTLSEKEKIQIVSQSKLETVDSLLLKSKTIPSPTWDFCRGRMQM